MSRRAPRAFRRSREAAGCRVWMSVPPAIGRPAHPVDPPPPPVDRAAWRIRAHTGASPAATPPYSRIAQLRFGTWASPSTSYVWRARTGFPPAVWSPSLSGWLPTTPPQGGSNMAATIAPAPRWHQRNSLITLAATGLKADLAPRHYRNPPPSDMPRKPRSVASGRQPVVTGFAHLAPQTARPTNTTTARIILSLVWVTSTSGRPGFAARRTLRPLSTVISRTSVALPGPSARTAAIWS